MPSRLEFAAARSIVYTFKQLARYASLPAPNLFSATNERFKLFPPREMIKYVTHEQQVRTTWYNTENMPHNETYDN